MGVSDTGRPLASRAWHDLPNLLTLLLFFTITAALFRSLEFALIVTASLGFHEAGHAAALSFFRLPWHIRFGLVGAWTWSPADERARLSPLANLAIHLGGPFFSLLLALAAQALHHLGVEENQRLLVLANFSAQVAFLNLLPLGSLTDGGKAVQRIMASLDHAARWQVIVFPVGVTAFMVALYALVQAPQLAPHQAAPFLLGLLLIGIWLAGSLYLETWRPARHDRPTALPPARPLPPRQVFLLVLILWDLLALSLVITAGTPFWLEPRYLLGYLDNLFAFLAWLSQFI